MADPWAEIHEALQAAGWEYDSRARHHRYRPPAGHEQWPAQLVFSRSSSDRRGLLNARATLRRLGLLPKNERAQPPICPDGGCAP